MAENEPISTSGGAATAAAMLNQPIVIDCGTSSMKAGFAGGTKPKVNILCLNKVLWCMRIANFHLQRVFVCIND